MNLAALDWLIVGFVFILIVGSVQLSRVHMRSVADFLAAGRTAGRYVLSLSSGVAALGAITVVNQMEMNFVAGFTQTWWGFTMGLVMLVLTVSGWVNYRFRETRALTLSQFFEMRYSRNFRVFAGFIAFAAGLINFGIFPAVEARFFIHYCGLPLYFDLLGIHFSTYAVVMAALLSLALYFVFVGGQVAIVISDFVLGVFMNTVFVLLLLFVMLKVDWGHISTAMAMAPENASKINPFKTSHMDDFNLWYFLIGVFGVIYGAMSWQGTQGYNASARSAHEAKMGGVLGTWRGLGQTTALLLIPIVAYTVMNHPAYSGVQADVNGVLATVTAGAERSQLTVPLVLVNILPVGLLGAFAALMLGASLTTLNTYTHSWGSILVQDVILPLRRNPKPLDTRTHLWMLRGAILFVAVFAYFFSLWFRPNEYIAMFFAITGAIFAGGSGAVIIGGLYWKRGTTAAAWTAMLTGSSIAVGGIIIRQLDPAFPINGQQFWMLAMICSSALYILVSLMGPRREVDLDRLLHRGRWEVPGEKEIVNPTASRGWRAFGMGVEFTTRDRALFVLTYGWTLCWGLVFGIGTVINLVSPVSDAGWMVFWRGYTWLYLSVSALVLVWFTVGGVRDLKDMFRRLGLQGRDAGDDGTVRHSKENT
jgi:SSS family solute:Na+ symporter